MMNAFDGVDWISYVR